MVRAFDGSEWFRLDRPSKWKVLASDWSRRGSS